MKNLLKRLLRISIAARSLIEDSDLWIGVTAVVYNMVMVSENVKHLGRVRKIHLENWVEKGS